MQREIEREQSCPLELQGLPTFGSKQIHGPPRGNIARKTVKWCLIPSRQRLVMIILKSPPDNSDCPGQFARFSRVGSRLRSCLPGRDKFHVGLQPRFCT